MRSPAKRYKELKFLVVLAFVIAACVIAVAENDNEDSNEVSTTVASPDVNIAVNENLEQQEVVKTLEKMVTTLDTNSAVNEASNKVPTTVASPDAVPTTLEQRLQKTISVDFINTPIEDAIKMITEQADVDYIKSPTVTGNITVRLTDVPLKEALKSILDVHGYGCIIDKNVISVVPLNEIAQKEELLDTKVYQITYADIQDVEKALQKFISKRGTMSSSRGSSTIIVTDTESKIKDIDNFIEKIDRVTPQVLVEVRIYDITSTDGFDIGADWTAGRNNPITEYRDNYEDISVAADGTRTTTKTIRKLKETSWGQTLTGLTTTDTYSKSKPFTGGSFDVDTAGTIRLALLDTVKLDIALNILRSEVGAKLLANPRILALDNEPADFKIVTQIPYTEVTQTAQGGSMTSTRFKDVGVQLKVTPHVTRDGMVRLNINPEFSVRVGSTTPPTVDTRKMTTQALVKDGQTVVLGGLRKREVTQDVTKIPILGDIPLLGNLFMDSEETVVTNELLIFITPTIVITQALSPNEVNALEATNFGGPRVSWTEDEKAEQRATKAGK
jgi:type IV pilus assembly protein PilQ